jgi:hypothetical protein
MVEKVKKWEMQSDDVLFRNDACRGVLLWKVVVLKPKKQKKGVKDSRR